MADQEVGEDSGQFPVDEELDEVVGEDETEHGAGEGDEYSGEAPQPGLGVAEVARAVDEDQCAHARGDEGHHQPEGVHVHPQAERELLCPCVGTRQFLPSEDGGQLGQGPCGGDAGHHGQGEERVAAPSAYQ